MKQWNSINYFNRIAPLYGRLPFVSAPKSSYERIASGLEGERALDVACGTGRLEPLLAQNFDKVIGIDAASTMIALAEKSNSDIGNVQFLVAKAQTLPFPDDFFDAVFCLNSLGLLGDDLKALAEMKRVLKQGGVLRFNMMVPKRTSCGENLLNTFLQELPEAKTEKANHLLGVFFRLVFNNVLVEWIKPG